MNTIPDKIMTKIVYNECHLQSLAPVLSVVLQNDKREMLSKTLKEMLYRSFHRESEYHLDQAREVLGLNKALQEARAIIKE